MNYLLAFIVTCLILTYIGFSKAVCAAESLKKDQYYTYSVIDGCRVYGNAFKTIYRGKR